MANTDHSLLQTGDSRLLQDGSGVLLLQTSTPISAADDLGTVYAYYLYATPPRGRRGA